MRFFKRTLFLLFSFLAIIMAVVIISNIIVENKTKDKIYGKSDIIPYNKVGLVLGTNKYLANNRLNPFYSYRIDAAVRLFKSGKIDFIIVSGDNRKKSYNEPKQMKNDLIRMGVPVKKIFLDYAGFRTLDSVVRCNAIFGQSKFTIISQGFHNKRAVYIALSKGYDAIGYNARTITLKKGYKTYIRELLARVNMMIDLYVIHKQPKFFGETIKIK